MTRFTLTSAFLIPLLVGPRQVPPSTRQIGVIDSVLAAAARYVRASFPHDSIRVWQHRYCNVGTAACSDSSLGWSRSQMLTLMTNLSADSLRTGSAMFPAERGVLFVTMGHISITNDRARLVVWEGNPVEIRIRELQLVREAGSWRVSGSRIVGGT
jgi:hypothetical protein